MTSYIRTVALAVVCAGTLGACVSLPGITSPIPGRSPAELQAICDGIRDQIRNGRGQTPEEIEFSKKNAREAFEGNNCPGSPDA